MTRKKPQRRTIEAFDDDLTTADDAPASPLIAEVTKTASPAMSPAPATTPAKARTATATTASVGLYFQPAMFEASKAAYLVDLDTQKDPADSYQGWLARALARHAARGAETRAAIAAELPDEDNDGGRGLHRRFDVPQSTLADVADAMTTDRRHGRLLSRNQFAGEAVRQAIEEARRRAGGELPPAPAQLPKGRRARTY